jgi:hypothetical protein
MEGDRKYKQNGYQQGSRDASRDARDHSAWGGNDDRPRQPGPRPSLDVTGPRLPRMVQSVTASRCHNCAVALPAGIDFTGTCPKCNAALHCCKLCSYFEPSTRFQCLKPIPVRIAPKDGANTCTLFKARVTVAREIVAPAPVVAQTVPLANVAEPRNASDARLAFDSLFKKD